MSLPGTHDSSAYTQPWPFVATQKLNIAQQLDAGIRYFDLRCGIVHDDAEMVHGPRLLGLELHQLLDSVYKWLDTHATEGLVVQIKEDRKPEQSSVHFAQVILENIARRPERWRTANTTPCLGELRGKIQLLRRYNLPSRIPYGIGIDVTKWEDNPSMPFTIHTWHQVQLTIQDHYSFSEPMPLPKLIASKGGDVSGLLEKAYNDADPYHWYINFTSAYEFNLYYQLTPRAIAIGGYYTFHWEDGMNLRLRNYLRMRPGRRRLGIVAMDFPESGSEDLIELIIRSNFAAKEEWWRMSLILILTVLALLVFTQGLSRVPCRYTGLHFGTHQLGT
ncbi:Putative phosphatidylinositol-specific phospholipase C, X domain-containing protein [Septoria linicola]|uniref:Phosphatidylinositol-specific phospholipase C, X domain-containing protein n=1 Tax=Septoria linicola TaxID=215465 RepID=A0A9Q9ADU5_9PEZI|nr:putative phosphatidylinositol-specific phospholipase C, X domain-containing protein [Septoria linicola]USW47122.1 Putative phosphatidylinositol-specific phospholipase C, X domain-containing protein [Septoria linicola]